MLKFILNGVAYTDDKQDFKTSYVEVYPKDTGRDPAHLPYFKTSYVEVYPHELDGASDSVVFQNILC